MRPVYAMTELMRSGRASMRRISAAEALDQARRSLSGETRHPIKNPTVIDRDR